MNAVGIITEYNPFHEGHRIHINESRRISGADVVVCVMSGDYVQRGEPAIIDKFARAQMAIDGGVDLVVELPVEGSLSSAEGFAEYAVSVLNELKVSSICFGCEDADIESLKTIAHILLTEPADFKESLKAHISSGESFAKARQYALKDYLCREHSVALPDVISDTMSDANDANYADNTNYTDYAELLDSPNNILGIEYIKSITKSSYDIEPLCIKRCGMGYNDSTYSDNTIPSASALRSCLLNSNASRGDSVNDELLSSINIPDTTRNILSECSCFPITFNDFGYIFYEKLEAAMATSMYDKNTFIENIKYVRDMSPETASRIFSAYTQMNNSGQLCSLEDFAQSVKTKQFALSRIKRSIMRFILEYDLISSGYDYHNINNNSVYRQDISCNYIRVLGFSESGRRYLSSVKDSIDVPLISKVADHKSVYSSQIHAHNIYRQVCLHKFGCAPASDYMYRPYIRHE